MPELPIDWEPYIDPTDYPQRQEYIRNNAKKIILEFAADLSLLKSTAQAQVLRCLWDEGEMLQRDITRLYSSVTPSSQTDLSHFGRYSDWVFTKGWRDVPREGKKAKGTKRMVTWIWVGPTVEQYLALIPVNKVAQAFGILETWMLNGGSTLVAGVPIEDCMKLLKARE